MAVDVLRVDSLRAAAAILHERDDSRFVGGGTLVVRAVTAGGGSIGALVLSDGLGLDQIRIDGRRVELGAAVTMAAVAAHPKLTFLHPVAHEIGGPAIRAMATIGGNLFAPYPYGEFAVALLALGAQASLEDSQRAEIVDLSAMLGRKGQGKPRIVRSVAFDVPPPGAFRFAKVMRRSPHGASVLSIAAVLPVESGRVTNARVAYGAMAPTPMRARVVERVLEGKPLDAETIVRAVAVAAEGCAPLSDPFASDWYRLNVLPVHLKRLLQS